MAETTTPTLPELDDLLHSMQVVTVPLRVRFRGVDQREVLLIEGPCGWGEFAPFSEYADPESARWLASAIEAAYTGWPAARRDRIPVNATVPAVAAEDVAAVLARFDGCHSVKVKVAERGQRLTDDIARVAQVRRLAGPRARLRVDANGAWSLDDAIAAIAALARYDLEYVEQPCAHVEDLRDLRIILARKGIDVAIAADESIRKAEDPLKVAALEAADLIVVKVAPLGGVRQALSIVERCGLPAVVSSALDTSVGIAAGIALATSLPTLEHACGLGTVELLADDITGAPHVPVNGELHPRRIEPDPAALARLAVPAPRRAWWRDRITRCHALLAAGR